MSLPAVIVVDPNPATHRRFAEAFPHAAWTVHIARDAREAAEVAAREPVLLALLSASLPGGSGYQLAADLAAAHPTATVLLMTGGYEVYNKARAAAAGVAGHLAKPFTSAGLQELVASTLGPLPAAAPAEAPAPPVAAAPVEPEVPPPAPVAQEVPPHAPLTTPERIATILPRDYADVPVVAVDPEVVSPALERAVLEVLPEVVEAVLRQALQGSPAFRDLVSVAVSEAVAESLPAIATRVVEARLAEIEAAAE